MNSVILTGKYNKRISFTCSVSILHVMQDSPRKKKKKKKFCQLHASSEDCLDVFDLKQRCLTDRCVIKVLESGRLLMLSLFYLHRRLDRLYCLWLNIWSCSAHCFPYFLRNTTVDGNWCSWWVFTSFSRALYHRFYFFPNSIFVSIKTFLDSVFFSVLINLDYILHLCI